MNEEKVTAKNWCYPGDDKSPSAISLQGSVNVRGRLHDLLVTKHAGEGGAYWMLWSRGYSSGVEAYKDSISLFKPKYPDLNVLYSGRISLDMLPKPTQYLVIDKRNEETEQHWQEIHYALGVIEKNEKYDEDADTPFLKGRMNNCDFKLSLWKRQLPNGEGTYYAGSVWDPADLPETTEPALGAKFSVLSKPGSDVDDLDDLIPF